MTEDVKTNFHYSDFDKFTYVMAAMIQCAAREFNIKDVRDITMVISIDKTTGDYIVFFKCEGKAEALDFEHKDLYDLCEFLSNRNIDLIGHFNNESIAISTEIIHSFVNIAYKRHHGNAKDYWMTMHPVFGYHMFKGQTCIMQFTGNQLREFFTRK